LSTSVSAPSTFNLPPSYGLALGINPTGPWIISGTVNNAASDFNGGMLYVAKTTSYLTPALASGIQPAGYFFNTIGEGTWGNQTALIAGAFNANTQHSQGSMDGTASAVGMTATGTCGVVGCSATWGEVISAFDTSGQTTPPFTLIGLEVDNYGAADSAHSGNHIGIQIESRDPFSSTPNITGHGLLFTASDGVSSYGNLIDGGTVHAVNGLLLNGATFTGDAILSPGFFVDGTGHTFSQTVQLVSLQVANLPVCNDGSAGTVAFAVDISASPVWNAAIGATGGGTTQNRVLCRNSAWVFD
jgi:hypothetical protein